MEKINISEKSTSIKFVKRLLKDTARGISHIVYHERTLIVFTAGRVLCQASCQVIVKTNLSASKGKRERTRQFINTRDFTCQAWSFIAIAHLLNLDRERCTPHTIIKLSGAFPLLTPSRRSFSSLVFFIPKSGVSSDRFGISTHLSFTGCSTSHGMVRRSAWKVSHHLKVNVWSEVQ